jgi:Concanavalin A-like lectin/glucanases superfamily
MHTTSAGVLWIAGLCLALPASVNAQSGCVPPPAGLIAWWRGEGNALDSAGTNNATLVDGVTFTSGEVGQGFLISGSGDDYVALPDVFPFPSSGTGNAPLTFEVWFETSSTNGGVILGQQDAAPFTGMEGWVPALYVGTNGFVYGHLFEGAGMPPFISNSVPVYDGHFHHAAVTYDGTNELMFVDGVLVAEMPFTQQGYGSGQYYYELGTGYTAGWPGTTGDWMPFTGVIDEASVYNRALTTSEIAAIYNAGSAGKCTASELATPVLRHRYSFNEPAGSIAVTDSAGGANGVVEFAAASAPYTNGPSDGSGFTGGGQLALAGANGYVALPSGLISTLTNVTFEVWVTWRGPASVPWPRVFDFGASDGGFNASGTGTNYVILTPCDTSNRLSFETSTVNPNGEVFDPDALLLDGPAQLPTGQETYIVVTYDPVGGSSQLYVNGALAASHSGALDALSKFNDENDWLGRSQWTRDPFFSGQYDEFRIWSGLLTPADITNHFAAGPDQQLGPPGPPWLSISHSKGNLILSWTTNVLSGYQLERAASLPSGTWSAVTNSVSISNATYMVTLPASNVPAFYRLKR